ncbi:MAG: helix-turn-helix transcriptional regulator [Coriobacteriales bacterium]|jgi:DNA-binding CsgD family transcriptional regulator|nr:helix-turn-helix transcriptional regulator [Coriobacteriales bacterium]
MNAQGKSHAIPNRLSHFLRTDVAFSYPAIGFAAFWLWVQISFISKMLSPEVSDLDPVFFYSHMVSVAVLASCLLMFIKILRLHHKSKTIGIFLLIASVALMSASVFMQALGGLDSTSGIALLFLSGFSSGLGSSFFYIAWGTHFEHVGSNQTLIEVGYGFLYAAIAYLLIAFLPHFLRLLITGCMPLCSSILLKQTEKRLDDFTWEHEADAETNSKSPAVELPLQKPFAAKLFIACVVFGFIMGVFRSSIFSEADIVLPDYLIPILISGSGLCLIVLLGNAFIRGFDYVWLYRLSFFIVVCGILLTALTLTDRMLVNSVSMLGIAGITTMLWGFLSDVAHRNEKRTAVVFGFGLSGLYFGMLLGSLFTVIGIFLFDNPMVFITSLTLSMLLLALTYVFLLPDRTIDPQDYTTSPNGRWRRRIDTIVDEYGLTPREKEVFVFLAQGQSARKIQESLHISTSTANAHRYHIYEKLGVGSKQELIDFVDERIPEE